MGAKKEFVKNYVLSMEHKIVTINFVHRTLSGVWNGMRWHDEVFDVSHSTVRRALEELVDEGKMKSYCSIGHCFDELRYEKLLSHRTVLSMKKNKPNF